MTVVPLHPQARYYCSICAEHFHEHERAAHAQCNPLSYCERCGRAFAPGDDECPMCGGGGALLQLPRPDDTELAALHEQAIYELQLSAARLAISTYPEAAARTLAEAWFEVAMLDVLRGALPASID